MNIDEIHEPRCTWMTCIALMKTDEIDDAAEILMTLMKSMSIDDIDDHCGKFVELMLTPIHEIRMHIYQIWQFGGVSRRTNKFVGCCVGPNMGCLPKREARVDLTCRHLACRVPNHNYKKGTHDNRRTRERPILARIRMRIILLIIKKNNDTTNTRA